MNFKRIKAIGKLLLLFGLPLGLVFGLFASGIYYGAKRQAEIATFEREWLGIDVEVKAPPAAEKPGKGEGEGEESETKEGSDPPAKTKAGHEEEAAPAEPSPVRAEPAPTPAPEDPGASPPAEPSPSDVAGPAPKADPLGEDLATRLALPVKVSMKVLVDHELIEARPNWIDYVQQTVSQASVVYETQFGIELELVSVGRWPVAIEGMSSDELIEDLESRPREGADVLVGFTDRPLDGHIGGKAQLPAREDPFNGAYAIVYATPGRSYPHLRTLLHELGHLFGAEDVIDPAAAEYRAGSWMSYANVPESQAPWIDAANRAVILERKDKPFRPAGQGD